MNQKLTTDVPELHPIPVKSPWYMIGIDFVGPLTPEAEGGSNYILTISDCFTKWVEALPTLQTNVPQLLLLHSSRYNCSQPKLLTILILCWYIAYVYQVFMRMGISQVMFSDQGGEFNNKLDISGPIFR